MVLRNYWWLLIWLFLFGGVSMVAFPKQEELVLGQRTARWGRLPAWGLALPYVIWAAWRTNQYGDTGVYRSTFLNMPTGLENLSDYIVTRPKGPGFVVFEYLFKTIISHSDVAFFFLVALLQIYFIIRIYRKYSVDYWLSFFLFVASTDYMSWMHNGIRQFIAVTLIFTCLPLLIRKRYVLMILVILIATSIHSTALIFFPFLLVINGRAWNTRTVLYILGLITAILFVDRVSNFIVNAMEDTVYEGDIAIFLNDDGTNILRVFFYAVPTVLSWVFRDRIYRADNPMINVCVNMSIISTGIYVFSYFTSGILVGAVPIYFSLANYILIPWLLENIFDSASALLLKVGFVGVYSYFFYFQVFVTWRLG